MAETDSAGIVPGERLQDEADAGLEAAGLWSAPNRTIAEYGGGYYGVMAAVTFLFLETRSLWLAWQRVGDLKSFLSDLGWQAFVGFSTESVLNGVWAGIWPFTWFTNLGLHAVWLAVLGSFAYRLAVSFLGAHLPAAKQEEDTAAGEPSA